MADLEPVKGLIELTDNFTSEIGLAEAALQHFSKENQESLKAVAEAAGLVGAAIIAIGVATIELGKRGSEVNEVNETLVHFAGGAKQAQDALTGLREGTKGTVDNFDLAKDAAHLLSTGVRLTAEDFATLGDAAFAMKSRGLGPAKDQLDLVSDALVTGRTRALAMRLGVADITNAHEEYAKKLGYSVDKLNEAGKAEANRIAVMKLLRSAVSEAGDQERSFADEFKFASARVQDWIDDLASAVASSKVFKAAFQEIERSFGAAFGGDNQDAINKIVHFLEEGAVTLVNFAQAGIVAARVLEGAWNGIKSVILGVLTVAAGVADGLVETLALVAEAGAQLKIIPDSAVQYLRDTRTELRAMTSDLASQTVEAAKAVIGHTEFDKTLDGLSQSLHDVEKAMGDAQKASESDSKALDGAAKSARDHAKSTDQLSASMINREKVQRELEKSIDELQALDSQYFAEIAKNSGTSFDEAKADVLAWEDAQKKALDRLDPLYEKKFADIERIAAQKLKGISSDWDSVRDNSLEGLQQMARKALQTYEDMLTSGKTFSREVLDAQLQKYQDLQEQVRNYGHESIAAVTSTTNQVKILDSAWDAVINGIDDANVKVKLLSGEVVSVAEAIKRLDAGGSQDVTSFNFADEIKLFEGPGTNVYRDPYTLAKQGYSFAEIVRFAFQPGTGPLPAPIGPRIPGFKDGGIVMVGEAGPEAVRLPFGSQVYPTGSPSSAFGGAQVVQYNTFHVNGTAHDTAREIGDILMNQLKARRYLPTAG